MSMPRLSRTIAVICSCNPTKQQRVRVGVFGRRPFVLPERGEMGEEWREVLGFPKYLVSNEGRVHGPRKMLTPWLNGYGYRQVTLHRDGQRKYAVLSRIVLSAFVGDAPTSMHAEHLDGDKENNCLSNLRWATPLENIRRKQEHGTTARGERNGNSKINEGTAREVKRLLASGGTSLSISKTLGVPVTVVDQIRQGRTWGWLV